VISSWLRWVMRRAAQARGRRGAEEEAEGGAEAEEQEQEQELEQKQGEGREEVEAEEANPGRVSWRVKSAARVRERGAARHGVLGLCKAYRTGREGSLT
jgi:hypothetical protein